MRDPFIFTDFKRKLYFLYGTNIDTCDGVANIDPFFETWISSDLKIFQGPYIVFKPKYGFWGVKNYWAPEVYEYHGRYYMFASFKGGIGQNRGTAVLVSNNPEGPFIEYSCGPVTLKKHECLDGTLYIDKDKQPWVIFCHEWTEIYYGKVIASRLSEDLSRSIGGDNITIVDTKTDYIPWIRQVHDQRVRKEGFLTDAPFIHELSDGKLLMLWSSYSKQGEDGTGGGYVIAGVISETGKIQGPWKHLNQLIMDRNIGHSALFRTFDGRLKLISHCNDTEHGCEHPVIFDVVETDTSISIYEG